MLKAWHGCLPCLLVTILCLGLAPACEKVTAERIETWKGTVKGPEKLQDALNDASVDPELRAQAAIALSALGKGEAVSEALAGMSAEARTPVVSALVRKHSEALLGEPAVAQVQAARDGLFSLRPYTENEAQERVDEALLKAVELQMTAGPAVGSSQSLSAILDALGGKGAPLLVRLMERPDVPHAELAEALLKVADDGARAEASKNLVDQARRMNTLPGGMWRALGLLGGPAAVAFLKEKVEQAPWQTAQQAARALQLRPQPQLASFALSKAADPKVHGNVREEMFGLAESCCGAEVLPGLLQILTKASDMLVRYRAFEAALDVGGASAVGEALGAFPAQASYKPEDVEDFLVKDTLNLNAAARQAALDQLKAASPLNRMVGVLVLEKVGKPGDAPAVQALASDKGKLKGFPANRTVGREAARVASLLAKGS